MACTDDPYCPLSSVVLRDCGPVITTRLKVARDRAWTLQEGVQLVPRVCALPRGFIAWRTDDAHEVLRMSCESVRRIVGPSGFAPAGTSLLNLLMAD